MNDIPQTEENENPGLPLKILRKQYNKMKPFQKKSASLHRMQKAHVLWAILFVHLSLCFTACQHMKKMTESNLPDAEKMPVVLEKHGVTRTDNYLWLNQRDNPLVLQYLKAEEDYTQRMLKHTATLQEKLFAEMKSRLKEEDQSASYFKNGYWYYQRYEPGKEYPIHCRKKESHDAPEVVILDVNQLAEGHAYCHAAGLEVSPDNNWLAYGLDTVSRRLYSLHFKNLLTGQTLGYSIPNTSGSCAWADDCQTIFYSFKDTVTLREFQIRKHILAANQPDETVYTETDETFETSVFRGKSGKYITIMSASTLTTEYQLIPANAPQRPPQIFYPRQPELEYYISHCDNLFFILTNDSAQNFRLMTSTENATSRENWKELIAHRPQVYLEDIEVFSDFLVLQERSEGLTKIHILPHSHTQGSYLDFGEQTYVASLGYNPEMKAAAVRYAYSSLTTPSSVLEYNMTSGEKTLIKQDEIPGGYNAADYHTERIFAKADDGILVPISLVYKKGMKRNGKNPLLLYGYGSYGYSTDPWFSSVRISLLDRGFIFAIAHVRGGQEMGRQWYDNGKMQQKKNTFTDFIACAQHLVNEKYTSQEHLYAQGGSAGGLLVGAVANMRPDLFHGIVANVPFVDVITTMQDSTIPLTTSEYDEWGNPEIKAEFDYMLSYSPYDNVTTQAYPAMLVTTGLHDSQVQYWEPAKWVAKLRDLKTDNNPLLLHINFEAGHGGASGRFSRLKEMALVYAFLLDLEHISQ